MKNMYKKLISVLVALAMLPALSAAAFAAEGIHGTYFDEALTESDEIIEYLLNAGYPSDIIALLGDAAKLAFFEGGYTYDSSEINIEDDSLSNVLSSLSNWTASIICSHISYSGGVARKNLTYTWKWEYSPVWALTDKVAMAWSGSFTAEPSTIHWTYKHRVGYTGSSVYGYQTNTSGYGYDDYNPGAGVGKGINITAPLGGSYTQFHTGTLSVDITKATSANSRESAVGRYYHKQIFPSMSLSFSESGPSISVSGYTGTYDQSSDSAVAFWAISA
jgi:hypothetical protein